MCHPSVPSQPSCTMLPVFPPHSHLWVWYSLHEFSEHLGRTSPNQCLATLLVTRDPSALPSYPPAYTLGSRAPIFNVHRDKASLSQTSPPVIAKRNTYTTSSVPQDPDTDLSPSLGQHLTSSCSLPWSSSQQASGEAGRPRGGCPLL